MYKVDLHGLKKYQNMYLVKEKLRLIQIVKLEENLKIVKLEIVTGKGNHSPNKKPVLFPLLTNWLKNDSKKTKVHIDALFEKGKIIATI